MSKSKKIRVEFRKNRTERTRITNWTRQFDEHGFQEKPEQSEERIKNKGDASRYRTVVGETLDEKTSTELGFRILPEVKEQDVLSGRVLRVHGVNSVVKTEDGQQYYCITSRVLKTLSTEQRQPVIAGDRVLLRRAGVSEGMIERVEPRHGTLSRESRHRRQILVTNVDQILLIASADQPAFKPNLLDRMLLSAEQSGITPIICINKADLADIAELQPVIGSYAQMGYKVLLLSAETGLGIDRLHRQLQGKESAIVGQSGVGKSSLLNAVDASLNLRVSELGTAEKGRHTTTTAELFRLSFGGYVADTPGLRQFMLWNTVPEEVFGLFRDLRPYENRCRFPDCTHSHEDDCAVKDAVADGRLDLRRYESYLAIRFGK